MGQSDPQERQEKEIHHTFHRLQHLQQNELVCLVQISPCNDLLATSSKKQWMVVQVGVSWKTKVSHTTSFHVLVIINFCAYSYLAGKSAKETGIQVNSPSSIPSPTYQCTKTRLVYITSNYKTDQERYARL